MENFPVYISIGFIATTLLSAFFIYRASSNSRYVLITVTGWLLFQGVITLTGFYKVTVGIPPRFMLLLLPPLVLIIAMFMIKSGRSFIDLFDPKWLTLLHIVRLPVELSLYALYIYKYVPILMTFNGGNLDILSGISAPIIFYFGYRRSAIGRKWLIVWNVACLLLLANIVIRAILSAPFVFQQFGFDQSNTALFYFPFSWLPGFIVPIVLLAHLITIRTLIFKK